MNSKPYMRLVKVSQSSGMMGVAVGVADTGGGKFEVGVDVTVGTSDVIVGVGEDGSGVGVSEGGSVGPDTLISTNQG